VVVVGQAHLGGGEDDHVRVTADPHLTHVFDAETGDSLR
jgi:multiple sugar transport system ATP-binding protein